MSSLLIALLSLGLGLDQVLDSALPRRGTLRTLAQVLANLLLVNILEGRLQSRLHGRLFAVIGFHIGCWVELTSVERREVLHAVVCFLRRRLKVFERNFASCVG